MKRLLMTAALAVISVGLAGCAERTPDTSAAEAWFSNAEELTSEQWSARVLGSGGGVVTRADDDAHVIIDMGEARDVAEILVACGGGGETATVSWTLNGADTVSSESTVSCTGEYESVGPLHGVAAGVTSAEWGYAAPGAPVAVSVVLLAP